MEWSIEFDRRADRELRALDATVARRIAKFFGDLRQIAEQLTVPQMWVRILSEALRKYLHGRQLCQKPWLATPHPAPTG